MYHRQLVVTLDSILDARDSNNNDSDSIDNTYTHFGNLIEPID